MILSEVWLDFGISPIVKVTTFLTLLLATMSSRRHLMGLQLFQGFNFMDHTNLTYLPQHLPSSSGWMCKRESESILNTLAQWFFLRAKQPFAQGQHHFMLVNKFEQFRQVHKKSIATLNLHIQAIERINSKHVMWRTRRVWSDCIEDIFKETKKRKVKQMQMKVGKCAKFGQIAKCSEGKWTATIRMDILGHGCNQQTYWKYWILWNLVRCCALW